MPQTAHVWIEDEDRSGAEVGIASIADSLITRTGDTLELREDLPYIALAYLWSEFVSYPPLFAKLLSASVRQNPIRLTKGIGLNYLNQHQIYDFRANPLKKFRPNEPITCSGFDTDEAGVAHYLALVLIVTNQRIPTLPLPELTHIHRCTTTATTAGAWSTLTLTEVDSLPVGDYEMWGARVEHVSAVAARFIFTGKEIRPAVIPVSLVTDCVHPFSQNWGKGIKFHTSRFPKLELVEVTGSGTVEVEMYLKKVG